MMTRIAPIVFPSSIFLVTDVLIFDVSDMPLLLFLPWVFLARVGRRTWLSSLGKSFIALMTEAAKVLSLLAGVARHMLPNIRRLCHAWVVPGESLTFLRRADNLAAAWGRAALGMCCKVLADVALIASNKFSVGMKVWEVFCLTGGVGC